MITIIVAADQNNLIGKKGTDNGMPWHNSEDFNTLEVQHSIIHY